MTSSLATNPLQDLPLTFEDIVAPLRELEAEIGQLADLSWPELRAHYVRLYRTVAQLRKEAAPVPVSSVLSLPADHADEQEAVQLEGEAEAKLQPHCRWSPDWHGCCAKKDSEQPGLPEGLLEALRAADQALNGELYDSWSEGVEKGFFEHELRFEVGQRVMANVGLDESASWAPATIVMRCFRVEQDLAGGFALAPYQLLLDEAADEDKLLIYSSIDDDQSVRAQSEAETEAHPSPSCDDRLHAAMVVLFSTWWRMEGGYVEADIGGLLDVDVIPGVVGRGLVDVECVAALNHVPDAVLGERCVRKLRLRLGAFQVANAARKAAAESESGHSGGGGESETRVDDLSFRGDSELLAPIRRDGRRGSQDDATAAMFVRISRPELRILYDATPTPFKCSGCGAEGNGCMQAPFSRCSRCFRVYYCSKLPCHRC